MITFALDVQMETPSSLPPHHLQLEPCSGQMKDHRLGPERTPGERGRLGQPLPDSRQPRAWGDRGEQPHQKPGQNRWLSHAKGTGPAGEDAGFGDSAEEGPALPVPPQALPDPGHPRA